jgi:mRNA degradation ribonuclease J1/J2
MRIVPLGGLGEVGKNMTVFETESGCVVGGFAQPSKRHTLL